MALRSPVRAFPLVSPGHPDEQGKRVFHNVWGGIVSGSPSAMPPD